MAVTRALAAPAGCWGQAGFGARHQGANPFEARLDPEWW